MARIVYARGQWRALYELVALEQPIRKGSYTYQWEIVKNREEGHPEHVFYCDTLTYATLILDNLGGYGNGTGKD